MLCCAIHNLAQAAIQDRQGELKASDSNPGHMPTSVCDNRTNVVSLVFSPKHGFMGAMAWRPAENGKDLFMEVTLGCKKPLTLKPIQS